MIKQAMTAITFLILLSGYACTAEKNDILAREFISPPESAKPYTWWHWMNGYISKEGITADLEAMKRAGLGGFHVFNVSRYDFYDIGYMSDQWHEMVKYAIQESDRLGLEASFHNCAGWTASGGPWITPEYAMKKVVWTERQVEGSKDLTIQLEVPEANNGYYRDIAVLAFPTPKSERQGQGFHIENWNCKAGFDNWMVFAGWANKTDMKRDNRKVDESDIIRKDGIILLSDKMDESGNLIWQAPEGNWTIVRFGYTPNGVKNKPAPPEGCGLESDKLSKAATELHWRNSVQKIIDDAGSNAGKVLTGISIDSFEVGCQNWTPDLPQEFEKRMGYVLTPYLPALTGRVVGSMEISERFLWDFRRVLADLFAENYYGHFAELCHKNGLNLAIEPYGGANFDELAAAAKADIPTGEFWVGRILDFDYSGKLASSSAHIYGRKYVGAEAFTCRPPYSGYQCHPYDIKALGDYYYCQGINRFVFHTCVHQPWMNVKPGMSMGQHGMQFNRSNTWFEKSSAWMRYLTRCQYMLQEGKFEADLCFLATEDAPVMLKNESDMKPQCPAGYDYDFCNTENLMQMKVENGRIVTPSGMSYRVLVLPGGDMRPAVLKQIEKLVKEGATIYGDKPEKSPSLVNYPAWDKKVKKIADKLWDSGKIISKQPLADVLLSKGILPDFEFSGGIQRQAPLARSVNGVEYIHRTINHADVYFVSNQQKEPQTIHAEFRVVRKKPELWYPDTGKIEEAQSYAFTKDGRMSVPLSFDPYGSVFVVFREPAESEKRAVEESNEPEYKKIEGSWTVYFPNDWGTSHEIKLDKLVDWTENENEDIKYFSGTAVYSKNFDFDSAGKTAFLDLGTVNVIAEVKLNGKNLGILWKPPFCIEITDAVKNGSNHLEVEVTNLLVNRLIGDENYPEDCKWRKDYAKNWDMGWQLVELPDWFKKGAPRPVPQRKTFATWRWYKKGDPLWPSGLLGPVQVVMNEK